MHFSQFVADGEVETEMIPVESERSAMNACVGSAAAKPRHSDRGRNLGPCLKSLPGPAFHQGHLSRGLAFRLGPGNVAVQSAVSAFSVLRFRRADGRSS